MGDAPALPFIPLQQHKHQQFNHHSPQLSQPQLPQHLVLAGDEADLAERVVAMITAPGGDAATVVPDE